MVMITCIYIFKVDETENLQKKRVSREPRARSCRTGAHGGLCGGWGATSSCSAESPGPQTDHQKPKQPSIIQQVQSEPAPEEKTWQGGGSLHGRVCRNM